MNANQLTWYMQEVSMHAYGAEIDMNRIQELLSDPESMQSRLVWFYLASFLSHAGMISKLVSPISKEPIATVRGTALKTALGVSV